MTLDLEAVARALFDWENDPILWCDHTDETRNYYRDSARIAARMIRAQVLEEAAAVAEDHDVSRIDAYRTRNEIAAAIRALKQP